MTIRKPIFRGDTKNESHKMGAKEWKASSRHPRQEFWDYLPLKKHMAKGFAALPSVREYLHSGKRLPKYAFEADGTRVFLFYSA